MFRAPAAAKRELPAGFRGTGISRSESRPAIRLPTGRHRARAQGLFARTVAVTTNSATTPATTPSAAKNKPHRTAGFGGKLQSPAGGQRNRLCRLADHQTKCLLPEALLHRP